MDRRAFVGTLAALAAPLPAAAQAPVVVRRIGVLSQVSTSDAARWHQAFRAGLRELGWIEGANLAIEYRYADGKSDRLPDLAAELVRMKVEVIVTSFTSATLAARNATKAIPIVMVAAADPVASGLVRSEAKPGGNVTGLSQLISELGGKRLELLAAIVPKLSRVAVLWDSRSLSSTHYWKALQEPARRLGLELHSLEIGSAGDLEPAFQDATRARAGALLVTGAPVITTNERRIADLAVKARLPSTAIGAEFANAGGLATYGPDRADLYRRAAAYVDKILKGAIPGDLPVEQPTKFELVINLATAKALGLTIPPAVLRQADALIR
jgi:putative ABC transport system substrate-binding protein